MADDRKMTFNCAIRAKSVKEGYIRKGGQNAAPAADAQRPAPPAAFRPALAPAAPSGGNGSNSGNEK